MCRNSKNTDFENQRPIGKREPQACAEPEIRYRNTADVEIASAQTNGGANNPTGQKVRPDAKRERLAAELANTSSRGNLCASCARELRGPPDNGEDIDRYRLIGKRELLLLVGISYSSVWSLMRRGGEFPISVRVGSKVYWYAHEVQSWLEALPRSEYRSPSSPGRDQKGAGQ